MVITYSSENHKKYWYVDFYILDIGERFSYKKEEYIKTNNDGAIKSKSKKFKHFWSQISVRMTDYYTLDQLIEKYPTLAYSY